MEHPRGRSRLSIRRAAAVALPAVALSLDLMAGGVHGRRVLVLGCGEVGRAAASALLARGARVSLLDHDPERTARLVAATLPALRARMRVEADLRGAVGRHRLIVDATPAAGIITEALVGEDTWIAAPGVPLGATQAASRRLGRRLLHDPLQIGVATMLVEALKR